MAQGKDSELILTVKMETRHPVEGTVGSEIPVICDHCGVITTYIYIYIYIYMYIYRAV